MIFAVAGKYLCEQQWVLCWEQLGRWGWSGRGCGSWRRAASRAAGVGCAGERCACPPGRPVHIARPPRCRPPLGFLPENAELLSPFKINLFRFINTHCEKYVRIWIQMNEQMMKYQLYFFLLQSSSGVSIKTC